MRAVRSTINTAGRLKRQDQDGDESSLVLKALVDINLPKFLNHDIQLFNNIISDLFPNTQKPESQLGNLGKEIVNTILEMNLTNSNEFFEKIKQL